MSDTVKLGTEAPGFYHQYKLLWPPACIRDRPGFYQNMSKSSISCILLIFSHVSTVLTDETLYTIDRYTVCDVHCHVSLTDFHMHCGSSKLDYCNSDLVDVQSVFNAAARLVFSARRSEHVTPLLHDLHWLKVPERIQFHLCVLTYRCLHARHRATIPGWNTASDD